MIELAKEPAELGLIRVEFLDARAGEAIEDTELLLAQALVDDKRVAFDTDTPCSLDDLGRALRSEIGRGQHDVGAFICGQGGKPASKGTRLFFSERAQRDIDIPVGDIDIGQTGGMGGIACDIAGALAMADDPEALRPALHR